MSMQKKPRIWLSPPHMGGDEKGFVEEAFRKNWIAPAGENLDGFEQDLKSYTGVNEVVALSSGTAAIHLALQLLETAPGDKVICQSFTFVASANPITYLGAEPVFIESEPQTWNMCPDALERAIVQLQNSENTRPRAIIIVHLYGMPAKVKEILRIAEKYDVPVIEDTAEALGSGLHDKKCGSMGTIGALSFNGNKIITTSGGGALLLKDKAMAKKARYLATQAKEETAFYEHLQTGYNYRMSNILAGIGRGQMNVLEQRISQKRAVFQYYFDRLGATWLELCDGFQQSNRSPTGIYFHKEPEGHFSNRWLTTIILYPGQTNGVSPEQLRLVLEKENIESRPLWKPMHMQPLFAHNLYVSGNGKISEWLFRHGLCLPSGSNLSEKELERIVERILVTIRNPV